MGRVRIRRVKKEEILAAIRAAARTCEGKPLSLQRFQRHSKISSTTVYKNFFTWKAATDAAGFSWPRYNQPMDPEALFVDWGNTVRKLGHVPSFIEHDAIGKYHPATVAARCGGWNHLPDNFRKFAEGKNEWADILPLLPPPGSRPATFHATARIGERIYGAPLNFKTLSHAPVNELGVVCLFGAMAADLGFIIESIQGAFPDCEAMRCSGKDEWRRRRIEFEYESRNFHNHNHPAEGCDIIVCWTHNWADCPANLEVIALRDELKRLGSAHGSSIVFGMK